MPARGAACRNEIPDQDAADLADPEPPRFNRFSNHGLHSDLLINQIHDMPGSTTVTSFGRVISVRGSLARVGLLAASQMGLSEVRATVGRFVSIRCANSTIVAMITEVILREPADFRHLHRQRLGRPARRNPRRSGAPEIPARRHQLSDHRRCRRPDHQSGAAHGLCAERIGSDQCRHPAAGSVRHRLCRYRGNALQALRGARLDRRRQIDRRVAAAERNSQIAAESADLPARRAQRIWPLFRRPRAGAQSAQSEAAVLAVQFRRDRRRAVRRPARRARGTRHSRRSHSDGEGHLYAVPELRPGRAEAHRSQDRSATPSIRRCPTAWST